jgi:hypothetical protein
MATPPAVVVPPTPEEERDEFGDAFAVLAETLREPGTSPAPAADVKTPEQIAADAAAAAVVVKTPEQIAADAAAAAVVVKTPEQIAADAATAAKTPEQIAAEQAAADALVAKTPEQLAAETAAAEAHRKLEEAQNRIKELEAATPPVKTAEQLAAEQAAQQPLYTKDEQALLDAHREQWGVVSKGEELIRRAEYQFLVKHIFEQIDSKYGPVRDYIESRTPRDQLTDIKGLVPDYEKVRDAAIEWAGKQPSIVKSAYDRVIKEGSAAEVAEMIESYRKATAQPAAATPALTVVPAKTPEQIAAVAALKPVQSNRTEPATPLDPSNFDDSFREFASAGVR